MGKIIAIVNQKGGVGKTTTSINLAASLGVLDKKVLLVDLDPQGNATTGVGIDKNDISSSIYEVLTKKETIEKSIIKTKSKNLYLLPAYLNLAGVDMELIELERKAKESGEKFNRVIRLKEELGKVSDNFDYILIDCPPSLGILTTNALAAANSVLIPVQCEYFALEGIMQLINTIMLAQRKVNPNLDIEGVLLTMFSNTNLGIEVIESIKGFFKERVYNTIIPRLVRLAEAPSHGKPILEYEPRNKGTIAYLNLAKRLLKEMEQKKKALGKGLEELFSSEVLDFDTFESNIMENTPANDVKEIPVNEIRPNPYQPRKTFNEEALNELAESIKNYGVFQPIIVKKSIKGYDLIAGERRLRASKLAGMETIPAIVKEFSDEEMREISLLENIQRENLTAIELAWAYKGIIDNLDIRQEDLAKKIGKSRSHITNTLGLLNCLKMFKRKFLMVKFLWDMLEYYLK